MGETMAAGDCFRPDPRQNPLAQVCSDLFSGGALENFAVGALSIWPYISASIILQLMTAVVPTVLA